MRSVELTDERFTHVKIWIAHDGENRNNSIFTKEALESLIPSLENIPILGFMTEGEDQDKDFTVHAEEIAIVDGEIEMNYLGRAYGVIPKDNDARFELRYGEDGIQREYLVCDGLLWNKFRDVDKIFERDGGFKSQSMELLPSSIEGYFNDNGVYVFTKAKLEGACILGEKVNPGMVSSTIERFSQKGSQFSEMLEEFNTLFSEAMEKGGVKMSVKAKFNEEPEVTEEQVEEEEVAVETEVDPESRVDEVVEGEDPGDVDTEFKENDKKEIVRKFTISHEDIRYGLYSALDSHEMFEDKWYWISKTYDNHAIVEVNDGESYYKVNYVKHENAVSIGDYEEIFAMFLSESEKTAVNMARNNFEDLESEVKELRTFKSNIELKEKSDSLSKHSESLTKEEYESIEGRFSQLTVEDVEKEVAFVLFKKNHFTATETEEKTKVSAVSQAERNPYGSAGVYFTK